MCDQRLDVSIEQSLETGSIAAVDALANDNGGRHQESSGQRARRDERVSLHRTWNEEIWSPQFIGPRSGASRSSLIRPPR